MRDFKYSVYTMIKLVGERPCIWDRTVDGYKDTADRNQAWKEICATLEDSYDEMSEPEKRSVEEAVIGKWNNIRDAYRRTLKSRMSGIPRRPYVYNEEMSFMKKVVIGSEYADDEIPYKPVEVKVERKKRKKTEEIYFDEEFLEEDQLPSNDIISEKLVPTIRYEDSDPRVMNEDEAFFASLLPTVVQYSLEERLEFRMDVLGVMKKINSKRKCIGDD